MATLKPLKRFLINCFCGGYKNYVSKETVDRPYYPGTFYGKPKINTALCFKNMKKKQIRGKRSYILQKYNGRYDWHVLT